MKINKITACKECNYFSEDDLIIKNFKKNGICLYYNKYIYNPNEIEDFCKLLDLIRVWHDPKEEMPKENSLLLLDYIQKEWLEIPRIVYVDKIRFKDGFIRTIKRWAYLDDILKLTGGIIE